MTSLPVLPNLPLDEGEDQPANPSGNRTLGDVVAERLSRRDLMRGALAVSVAASVAGPLAVTGTRSAAAAASPRSLFDFAVVAAGSDEKHHVAAGYDADILVRWGDPVLPGAAPFDPARPSASSQAQQFGYNNDFIGFIPLDGGGDRGLLVVNHEYTNDELMYFGLKGDKRADRVMALSDEEIRASMAAHGGSIIEVERVDGRWRVLHDSKYARRITASTPMQISGPAAGHPLMRTQADPTGTKVLGMLNNCAGGVTPWGTWLTCEENVNYYFSNKDAAAASPLAKAYSRYGVPEGFYPWNRVDGRFDVGAEPNECHRFGWVVEIDPLDPASTPKKRTALGRFKHEGAGNIVNKDGRFVVYQGDEQRFDYVYKFVTEGRVSPDDRRANMDLLDAGTLYVARFDANGRGEWLALRAGDPRLQEFADQGQILIHARLAADRLGATKMDRPEDVEASPRTGKVYVMLTNNDKRTAEETDAANPRAANRFGHIVEITPDDGDHASTGFSWEILVKCGDPSVAAVGATFNPATTANGWFGMPDNCAIDADGRLWVATDGNSAQVTGRTDGLFAMETDGALRGTSKLFFRCPIGAELCGPCFTPDLETLFVAVQHPGESEDPKVLATAETPTTRWPDFKEGIPPRPSVVAITRRGGGKIGV
ncbi:MAG: PhoX family protein [Deltaproteobacteria bacterium]